ncbi:MAG: hypothetical protein ACXABK_00010, partial [Candidatus Heimdallarchaeaceae archaeon]
MGPNTLFYCYDCSIPLINSHNCPICNKETKIVPLTPPYDVRPGKTKEIKEIQELIIDTFGEKAQIIEDDDIVLLNHVGSEDQMDEIILYGKSIGTRRYDLATNKWIIK